jgi:glycosyltransferase involved in cell wall biosynthesis
MLISVVIPTYNEEKYIGRTLDTIKALKHPGMDVEVLVIDSESKDKTQEIARRHKVKVISSPLRGIGHARQRGLQAAHGDIVAFTDADTAVPADWLVELVKTLKKDGVSGVYGYYYVPDGWWVYRIWINGILKVLIHLMSFLGGNLAAGQNMAFWRTKALAVGGFDETLTIFEDMQIMQDLKKVGKVVYLPRVLVTSSGRRGNEGWRFFSRCIISLWKHYVLHKRVRLFPDIR